VYRGTSSSNTGLRSEYKCYRATLPFGDGPRPFIRPRGRICFAQLEKSSSCSGAPPGSSRTGTPLLSVCRETYDSACRGDQLNTVTEQQLWSIDAMLLTATVRR